MTKKQREAHERNPRPHKRLSLKQRLFVNEYIKTKGNATEAARNSFDVTKRENAKALGYQTLERPQVQEAIAEKLENAGMSIDQLNEWTANSIQYNLKFGRPSQAVATKNLEMMYKLYNAFPANKKLSMHVSARLPGAPVNFNEALQQATKTISSLQEAISQMTKK